MADKRDYYEVLGVSKDATDAQIKSAFRKAAKTCHPDLHPDDKEAEARFKELNEAYEVLSDADKRAKYDQFGHAAFDPSMGGGGYQGGAGFGGFEDIFSSFFGGGFGGFGGDYGSSRRDGPAAGNDLRYNLSLTFEEAANGVTKEITVPREEECESCHGTGAKAGTSPTRCSTCNGSGQVRTQQNTPFGAFTTSRPCSACGGTGKFIKEPCPDCRGKGRVRKNARISVKVPAGIDDGQTLNVRDQGEAGYKGGPRGNLYVTVTVKPHKQFTRNGSTLILHMQVPFTTMAMGGEIEVPTLRDPVRYTIGPGTQNGTTFRLREQGIPIPNTNARGDLLVKVECIIPKRLTDQQKEILQQFAIASGDKSAPKPSRSIRDIFKNK